MGAAENSYIISMEEYMQSPQNREYVDNMMAVNQKVFDSKRQMSQRAASQQLPPPVPVAAETTMGTGVLPPNADSVVQTEQERKSQGLPFKKLTYDNLVGQLTSVSVVDAYNMGLISKDNQDARRIIELQRDVETFVDTSVAAANPVFVPNPGKAKQLNSDYVDTTKDNLMIEDINDVLKQDTVDNYLVNDSSDLATQYDPDAIGDPHHVADDETVEIADHNVLLDSPELVAMQEMMQTAESAGSYNPAVSPSAESMAETLAFEQQIMANGQADKSMGGLSI